MSKRVLVSGLAALNLLVLQGVAFAQGAPVAPQPAPPPPAPGTEMREAVMLLREIAKSSREGVDYGRVVPDLLTQMLTKLDKLEDKLDKVENAMKASQKRK